MPTSPVTGSSLPIQRSSIHSAFKFSFQIRARWMQTAWPMLSGHIITLAEDLEEQVGSNANQHPIDQPAAGV